MKPPSARNPGTRELPARSMGCGPPGSQVILSLIVIVGSNRLAGLPPKGDLPPEAAF
jgi:hypothetical protein